MKKLITIIISTIMLSSCATDWFITDNQEHKFRTVNISVNESDVIIKNKKDEVVGSVSHNGRVTFYMDFLGGELKKKNLLLHTEHPDRVSETFQIQRKIRPGALTGDIVLGLVVLVNIPLLTPAISLDFINTNIWKVGKDSRNINLKLEYNNRFYDRKLKEIEGTELNEVSSYNSNNILRDPQRKDRANVFWNGDYTLFCLYSDEPIFPNENGQYDIFYSTNEDRTVKEKKSSIKGIKNFTVYKFKSREYAQNWCARIKFNPEKSIGSNNQESYVTRYEDYIIEYPKSPFLDDAQKRIYEIAFDIAVYYNTIESFQGYIVKYPKSHLISEAKNGKIKVKEMDDAYANAKKVDNPETHENFLKKYPISRYSKEIQNALLQSYYRINSKKIYNLNEANNMMSQMKKYEARFSLKYTNSQYNLITNERDKYIVETLKSKSDKTSYWNFLEKQYEIENSKPHENQYDLYAIKNRAFTNRDFTYSGHYNLWNLDGSKEDLTYKNSIRIDQYIKYDSTEKTILYKGNFKDDPNATSEIPILTHKINFPSGKLQYLRKYDNAGNIILNHEYDGNGVNLSLEQAKNLIKEGDRFYANKVYDRAINYYNQALEIDNDKKVVSKLNAAKKKYEVYLAKEKEKEKARQAKAKEEQKRREKVMPTIILQYLKNEGKITSLAEIQDFKMERISSCFSVSIVRVVDFMKYGGHRLYKDFSVDISNGNPCFYEYSSKELSELSLEMKSNFLKRNYQYFLRTAKSESERDRLREDVDTYYKLYKGRASLNCKCVF